MGRRRRRRTPSIKPSTPSMRMPVQWSNLPDDLLRVVYSKVVGPLQRIRFAAVCRSWRAAVITLLHASPSVLPWLILSHAQEDDNRTKMYCPKDNQVFPVSLPIQTVGKRFVGVHDGGWVAVLGDNMELAVVNLFSGIEVLLPVKDMWTVCPAGSRNDIIPKVVFSESPASSGCILAAITSQYGVALCRIGCPNGEWTEKHLRHEIVDISFCNGQLYCLTIFEDLFKLEIGANKHHEPVVTAEPHLLLIPPRSNPILVQSNNIVELHGKLVMVVRTWPSPHEYFPECEPFFRVFELADESTTEYTYKWEEVMSLGDYAIFLGKMWSKAVYLSAVGHNELPRSCIYTTDDLVCSTRLRDHGYRLYPTSVYVKCGIQTYVVAHAPGGMWFLPPDF